MPRGAESGSCSHGGSRWPLHPAPLSHCPCPARPIGEVPSADTDGEHRDSLKPEAIVRLHYAHSLAPDLTGLRYVFRVSLVLQPSLDLILRGWPHTRRGSDDGPVWFVCFSLLDLSKTLARVESWTTAHGNWEPLIADYGPELPRTRLAFAKTTGRKRNRGRIARLYRDIPVGNPGRSSHASIITQSAPCPVPAAAAEIAVLPNALGTGLGIRFSDLQISN